MGSGSPIIGGGALRCSKWAREEHLSPIGTCGSYDGYLLLPVPRPWPRDIGDEPLVKIVAPLLAGHNIRLQAVVPSSNEDVAVSLFIRAFGAEGFFGYLGYRADAPSSLSRLPEVVEALLETRSAQKFDGRMVLVCTHGRRDVCCGSQGTQLSMRLADTRLVREVELRRTSHTGGHRFAPTFLVLPEGTAWAFADVALVETVLSRTGDAADVADRYRGCAGLEDREVQALEREVLARVGWGLLDRPRRGRVVDSDGAERLVELVVHQETGTQRWHGVVSPGRVVRVPDCMHPIEEAKKWETEMEVRDVTLEDGTPVKGSLATAVPETVWESGH